MSSTKGRKGQYLIMVRRWHDYAGEGGDWVWDKLVELDTTPQCLEILRRGLRETGLLFSISLIEGK